MKTAAKFIIMMIIMVNTACAETIEQKYLRLEEQKRWESSSEGYLRRMDERAEERESDMERMRDDFNNTVREIELDRMLNRSE